MTAGHSDTPLARQLSLTRGMRVWFKNMPDSVRAAIDLDALGVSEQAAPSAGLDGAHLFATDRATLATDLHALRDLIEPAGQVWVSWPTEAGGAATGIDEDIVREVARPIGWIDVQACAVDASWSGLKLVIAKNLRGA